MALLKSNNEMLREACLKEFEGEVDDEREPEGIKGEAPKAL